jgi:hypothetical protein
MKQFFKVGRGILRSHSVKIFVINYVILQTNVFSLRIINDRNGIGMAC